MWTALVLYYFLRKAPVTLQSSWTHDDLMNAYRAIEFSWQRLLADTVLFFRPTPFFRPLGQIFYRLLFDAFGWDPLPYRVAMTTLLAGNAFLLGYIAFRLTGSLGAGLAAIALAVYHPNWIYLYLNTGTIFETLAAFLVWLAFAAHIETRAWRWSPALIGGLFVLALNSKESAIVLPGILLAYEWLWHRRLHWRLAAVLGTIALAFILGRVYGPQGLASVSMYQPQYSLAMYGANFTQYFRALVMLPKANGAMCLLLCLAPLALWNRTGVLAAFVFPFAILPLAFVPERGMDSILMACAWLPFSGAALLSRVSQEPRRILFAALLLVALYRYAPARRNFDGLDREFAEIRNFRQDLVRLAPTVPHNAQLRFVSEPFNDDTPWASTFIARLAYRDMTVVVVTPNNPHTRAYPANRDWAVFSWNGTHLERQK